MPIVDSEDLAVSLNFRCPIELYQRVQQFAHECAPQVNTSEAIRLLLDVGEQQLRGGVSFLGDTRDNGRGASS